MSKRQEHRKEDLDDMLMQEPLPCRIINQQIMVYLRSYGDDAFLENYQIRYKQVQWMNSDDNPYTAEK
jgi:hypothetical protein